MDRYRRFQEINKLAILKNKKKKAGIVFWVTGYPGSGKTEISKKIHKKIENKFGKTIEVSGDELRNLFNLKGYKINERKKIGYFYSDLCKNLSNKGTNVLINVVCLFDEVRKRNRANLKRYVEIYVKSDFKKILKRKEKIFYKKKQKNVWGQDLKAELPKKPDITLENNFSNNINILSENLFKKILKLKKIK